MDLKKHFTVLARQRKNFVLRDSQVEMAQNTFDHLSAAKPALIVDDILPENSPATPPNSSLLIEAGTGTGKSLAYLIPAILAEKKTIISTNTKALQKQVLEELKDLKKTYPTLEYSLLQGAANYACILKAENAPVTMVQNWINQQIEEKKDGMIDGFRKAGKKFNKDVWQLIATDSNLCQESCKHFNQCFFQNAKKEAKGARVLVVNHDLLLLMFKIDSELFENAECIILDEAHHFPDKCRQILSQTISSHSISKQIHALNWKCKNVYKTNYELDASIYEELEEKIFDYFPDDQLGIIRINEFHPEVKELIEQLRTQLESDGQFLKDRAKLHGEEKKLLSIVTSLNQIFWADNDNWFNTLSIKQRGETLIKQIDAVPLDIGKQLYRFYANKKIVFTSATIRSGNSFEFFKSQIGQKDALAYSYPSPFSRKHTSIFIPKEAIEPFQEDYHQKLTDYMVKIHKIMKGRSLFLFTNKEDLESCKKILPSEIFKQFFFQNHSSEVPHMIETLQNNDNISLAGLSTLWEGIDVVGKALSCVCIMRMPFSNPDDVIINALKTKFMQDNGPGKSFFEEHDLPLMMRKLKQGIGRLIRHETDTGLVVFLDNRFLRKNYKNKVIELLEDYDCFHDLDDAVQAIPNIDFGRFTRLAGKN